MTSIHHAPLMWKKISSGALKNALFSRVGIVTLLKVSIDEKCVTIDPRWKRNQVQECLEQCGMTLTPPVTDESTLDSLVTCIIQHASGNFWTSSLQEAVVSIIPTEADRIQFLVLLEKKREELKRYLMSSNLENQTTLLEGTLGFLSAEPIQFCLNLNSVIPCIVECLTTQGIIRIANKTPLNPSESKYVYLWQDAENGSYYSIIKRQHSYSKDHQTYVQILLSNISRYARDFFSSKLDEKSAPNDETLASTAEQHRVALTSCLTVTHYLSFFNLWNASAGLTTALEELIQLESTARGEEASELVEDLRREIFSCLADATKDSCLHRAKLYETARLKSIEERDEAEKENWILKVIVKKNREKIALLKKELEVRESDLDQAEQQVDGSLANLTQAERRKNEKEGSIRWKETQFQKTQKELEDKKIKVQKEIDNKNGKMEELTKQIRKMELEKQEIQRNIELDQWMSANYKAELDQKANAIAKLDARKKQIENERKSFLEQQQNLQESYRNVVEEAKRNAAGIEKCKAELRTAQEEDAWNWFRLKLEESIPPLPLAAQGSKHQLFSITTPKELLDEVQRVFEIKAEGQRGSLLRSYVKTKSQNEIIGEMHNVFTKMISEPKWSMIGCPWKVSASALTFSDVLNTLTAKNLRKCEEIHICASRVIYIDRDWITPGISLALSAPFIKVIGSRLKIDTSGEDAKAQRKSKAKSGRGSGLSGDDGAHGEAGQSAGHVTIVCDNLQGDLRIEARGGAGSDGQSGGDGADGLQGSDGEDGSLSGAMKDDDFIWIYKSSAKSLKEVSYGKKGVAGRAGGNGGKAGCGGQGGKKGEIRLECRKISNDVDIVSVNGNNGADGEPGIGSQGGKGGRNGKDIARVFEPNFNTLSVLTGVIKGRWKEYRGNLDLKKITAREVALTIWNKIFGDGDPVDLVIGYKVYKRSSDNGRASRGENGQRGSKAKHNQKNTTIPKRPLSRIEVSWKNSSTSNSSQTSQHDIDAITASIHHLKSEDEKIEKHKTEIKERDRATQERILEQQREKDRLERERQQATLDTIQLEQEYKIALERKKEFEKKLEEQRVVEEIAQGEVRRVDSALIKTTKQVTLIAQKEAQKATRFQNVQLQDLAELKELNDKIRAVEEGIQQAKKKVSVIESEKQCIEKALRDDRQIIARDRSQVERNRHRISKAGRNQSKLEERIRQINELGSRLSEKIMKDAKVVQKASSRLQRTADHQLWEDDSDLEETTCHANIIASNVNVDLVIENKGLKLLENLVVSYAETDVRKSLALASMSQSLALLSENPKIWDAVTAVIHKKKDDPDALLQYIDIINKDILLLELLLSDENDYPVIKHLQKITREKNPLWVVDNDDIVEILYTFYRTPWLYKEIRSFLEIIQKDIKQSAVHFQLKNILERQLLLSLGDKIISKCSISNPTELLNRLHQMCYDKNNSSTYIGCFYDALFDQLDKTKTTVDAEKVLEEFFTLKLLGIEKFTTKFLDADAIQSERFFFWLDNTQVSIAKLEEIRMWADHKLTKEKKEILNTHAQQIIQDIWLKVDEVFRKFHWEPAWSQIQSLLEEKWSTESDLLSVADPTVKEFKVALEWRNCTFQSYSDKLKECSELQKQIENAKDLTTLETWVRTKTVTVNGSCDEGESAEPSLAFIKYFDQLEKSLSYHNKVDITKLLPVLRRVLYLYDQGGISMNAAQLKKISNILEKTNVEKIKDEAFKRDWTNLKTTHSRKWTTTYKLFQPTKQNQEFCNIHKEIKKKWKEVSIDAASDAVVEPAKVLLQMDILLLKYGLLTSWFLSPFDFVHSWRSLQTIKPKELEDEIKKRVVTDFSPRINQLACFVEQIILQNTNTGNKGTVFFFSFHVNIIILLILNFNIL